MWTISFMARRAECYVDTSAFIAFLDQSDSYHPLFRRLFSNPPALATSCLVLVEGHGWFLRRYDPRRAIEFLNFIAALAPLSIVSSATKSFRKRERSSRGFTTRILRSRTRMASRS